MSMTHEVITIQSGKYANFIGSHWWNIQEASFCYSPDSSVTLDINHDVTFREGLNLRGELTYTPRLVLIDLQENYRSPGGECSPYRIDESCTTATYWDGPVEVIKKKNFLEETEISKNSDFEETGQSSAETSEFGKFSTAWSDFLKTEIHPNSLCLFNEVSSSGNTDPFELYSNGEEIYDRSGDVFEESIRKMSEDCDYLQGFQLMYDAYNGFSGVNNRILQYLDDEYKRRPSLCFPVYQERIPIQDLKKQMHRLYAILLSISNMNEYCTFFSPLSLSDDIVKLSYPYKEFPYMEYNEKLLYHTSAILATAIETLSSPFRLRSAKFLMDDSTSILTTYGRKLVCSSVSLPFPLSPDAYLSAMVEKEVQEYYMTSLSPFYKPSNEQTLIQSAVLRGIPVNRFQNPKKCQYQSLQCDEVFGEYVNKYSPSSVTTVTVLNEKCTVSDPFPKLLKNSTIASDFLNSSGQLKEKGKIPIAASFSSSDSASQLIEDLLSQANNIHFKEYIKCTESTYEKDDYSEIIENLIRLQDNYTNY